MYITTNHKIHFTPLDPKPEQILIEDIAHAQSLMTRANGHFPEFYSVAQHSIACTREAMARGYAARVALACLIHDGSEAYLSDITRPVKQVLDGYRQIEKKVQDAIYCRFLGSLPTEEEMSQIKDIDDTCLYYEFDHYMGEKLMPKAPACSSRLLFTTLPFGQVEQEFLSLYHRLTQSL